MHLIGRLRCISVRFVPVDVQLLASFFGLFFEYNTKSCWVCCSIVLLSVGDEYIGKRNPHIYTKHG